MTQNPHDELARSLGHFVMAFNDLEVALAGVLMRILQSNDEVVGNAFVVVLGFRQKSDLIKALAPRVQKQGVREELLELLDEAGTVNEARNRFFHSEYRPVYGDEGDTMGLLQQRLKDFLRHRDFSAMEEFVKRTGPTKPEDITDLANDAASISQQMLRVSERFWD
jgi:hypothetical protein